MANDDNDSTSEPKRKKGVPAWLRIVSPITNLASLKRGGKVKKTGPAYVHKGEKVIPRNKVKKVEKAVRKAKKKSGREM